VNRMNRLSNIVVTIAMTALMCVLAEELYPDRYDNLDISALLNNETLRTEYYNCFMEIAPCKTPEQAEISGRFSEMYQTNCKKCTEKQKENLALVADWFVKNQPEIWQQIVAKTVEDMKKKNAGQ